jgi:hypothetical protein
MLQVGDWVRYSNKFLREVKPAGAGFHQQMMLVVGVGTSPAYQYRRGKAVYLGRILSCSVFGLGSGSRDKSINSENLCLVHKGKHIKLRDRQFKVGDEVIVSGFAKQQDDPDFASPMLGMVGGRFTIIQQHMIKKDRFRCGDWWWPSRALSLVHQKKEKKKHESKVKADYRAPWAR